MKWIESAGGPLVVVPQTQLEKWCGVAHRTNEAMSDYERACRITSEVATISVNDVSVLVLGDEPFRTTWVQQNDESGLLLRWIYADSEESIARILDGLPLAAMLSDTGVSFATSGTCVLFDSAEPGDDIRGESAEIDLACGVYAVGSAILSPSAEVRILVHKLARIP